jgi:hypothetical protein
MPFKHLVDNNKNIVVLKAVGKVSVMDIITEIRKAIDTKRGDGITRRLVDMSDQTLAYDLEDAKKILPMIEASASILGSKKIAVLFKEATNSSDIEQFISLLRSPNLEIEFFSDKTKAANFLSKSPAKREKKMVGRASKHAQPKK